MSIAVNGGGRSGCAVRCVTRCGRKMKAGHESCVYVEDFDGKLELDAGDNDGEWLQKDAGKDEV